MMDAETSLDLSVLEALEFDEECTHPQHNTSPDMHRGKGEWWMQLTCPTCGYNPERLVCARYKWSVATGYCMIYCGGGCGTETRYGMEWVTKLEKK